MNSIRTGRGATLARALALATAAAVVLSAAGIVLWSSSTAGAASSDYQRQRQALAAQLGTASQLGYTASDLAPVNAQVNRLDNSTEPWWPPGRPGYFQAQAARAGALRSQLSSLEQRLQDQARTDAGKQADAARTAIAQAQQANAADLDLGSLQQRLDAASRGQGAAHSLKDYQAAAQRAQGVAQDATALAASTQQENQQIAQAAQQLVTQSGGNVGAIQQAGNQAVFNANNDASVIAYLGKEGPFKGADTVARMASRLSKYAGLVGSGDPGQAALGAAAAQRYGSQIHDAMMAGLPAKSVIVSFQAQHVWAYEGSNVVMDNAVTTGIRGVGDFGTDFGPMKVLHKDHPWKFQSPWPKGTPHWYPDTVVQWTTFFTSTGEAFHDAAWQPDSTLGPGSQFTQGLQSHGCIHLPAARAQWMYDWAAVGMPVIVYPGDGTSVANQLSQITTNDQGVPHSGGG